MAQIELTAPVWDCDELREMLGTFEHLKVTERTTGRFIWRRTVFAVSGEQQHLDRALVEHAAWLQLQRERNAW